MDKLAESLGQQMIEEQQAYLDNARLKHGVPLRTLETLTGGSGESVPPAAPQPRRTSLLKTVATLGLTAAAGAIGIPPVVSSLADYWMGAKPEPPTTNVTVEPAEHATPDSTAAEWNDLIGFLRSKGYDRANNPATGDR